MRNAIFFLLIVFGSSVQAQALPALQGDAEAVARIEKMYSLIGGRDAWARARTMSIHYRQLSSGARPGEGVEYAWRDMERPRERLEWIRTDAAGNRFNWGRGNDEQRGWRRAPDGAVFERSSADLKGDVEFWERDFYTLFKRMALGSAAIRYGFKAPNRIEMTEAGKPIGWWEIDSAGWLLQWGTTDNDGTPFSYHYGPYKRYGDIAFPAWGVSGDGLYRFEYVDFRISPKPFPEQVLQDPTKAPEVKGPDGA